MFENTNNKEHQLSYVLILLFFTWLKSKSLLG
jgi:hypothetical protein